MKLSEKRAIDASDLVNIASHIVAYLTENPGDFSGAGQEIGISRDKVISLIETCPELFDYIEDQYFDKLNSLCRRVAMGVALPPGHEKFDFSKAKTLLTWRQKEITELKRVNRKEKPITVKGLNRSERSQAIEEYLKKSNLLIESEENGPPKEDNTIDAVGARAIRDDITTDIPTEDPD